MQDLKRVGVVLIAAAALSGCSTVQNVGDRIWPFGKGTRSTGPVAPTDDRVTILTFEQKLVADPTLAAEPVVLPQASSPADWPMVAGPANAAPGNLAAGVEFKVAWKQSVGEGSSRKTRVSAPPVIENGVMYVLDGSGDVIAVDAATGKRKWKVSPRPEKAKRDRYSNGGGLALGDGKLFVVNGFGFVAALSPNDGSQIWRSTFPSSFHGAPAVKDGKVYIVSSDNELLALDTANGNSVWTFQAIAESARILSPASASFGPDVVIAPFASGELVALVPSNGRRLWSDALSRAGRLTSLSSINDIPGRPVVFDQAVIAASHSGVLAAIDLSSGERGWSRAFPSTQTPATAGGWVFAVTVDSELACLRLDDGKVRWVTQLPRYKDEKDKKGRIVWTGPVLAGGQLVLASSEGQIVGVDPTDGSVKKTLDVKQPVFAPISAAGEYLYLYTDEGNLIALK